MQTIRSHPFHVIALSSLASTHALAAESADASPSLSAELVSLMLPLLLVVATLLAAFYLLRRRFGLATREGPLRVAQVIAVGPRERIVLLDLDDRQLLVGVTSAQITRLATLASRARDEDEHDPGPKTDAR
jgi:flagellar biosynthetic protein FliO